MPACSLHRGLTIAAVSVLLLLCLTAIVSLPAMVHGPWPLIILAALWAVLLLGPDGTHLRRPRRLLGGVLGCWLGLLGWAQLCGSGIAPATKSDPEFIRIVTWNIHCGQDAGPPWQRFDWPARKQATLPLPLPCTTLG